MSCTRFKSKTKCCGLRACFSYRAFPLTGGVRLIYRCAAHRILFDRTEQRLK
jgi:hypothetical protein